MTSEPPNGCWAAQILKLTFFASKKRPKVASLLIVSEIHEQIVSTVVATHEVEQETESPSGTGHQTRLLKTPNVVILTTSGRCRTRTCDLSRVKAAL